MAKSKKPTRTTRSTSAKQAAQDSADENEADDEGEPQGDVEISEGEGGSSKSAQSIELMVKEMLADATFLKDIKTNRLVRTMVMNWLQELPTEPAPSEVESVAQPAEETAAPVTTPAGNVWNQFDVAKLKNPHKKLEFYAPEVKDGEVFARMSIPSVQKEVEYWSNAVVVSVLGAFPPYHVMNGFIRRIWKEFTIDKIVQVQKGVFIVRFGDATNREMVIQRGSPPFDHKPIIITPWHANMELKPAVHQTNVWLQFPALPLKYWGDENLCRLASQVGIPVDIDDLTLKKDRGQFARVQVTVEIKEDVIDTVRYLDENGRLCEQLVHYEWLPVICSNCKAYGHRGKECRKAKPQVWVPKQKPAEPQVDAEGWQTVQRRRDRGKGAVSSPQRGSQTGGSSEARGGKAVAVQTGQATADKPVGVHQRRSEAELVDKGPNHSK